MQAQAALAQARATLSKTEVRAPFDGVVILKDAEVGEVVAIGTAEEIMKNEALEENKKETKEERANDKEEKED